jgi:hypothetical protein
VFPCVVRSAGQSSPDAERAAGELPAEAGEAPRSATVVASTSPLELGSSMQSTGTSWTRNSARSARTSSSVLKNQPTSHLSSSSNRWNPGRSGGPGGPGRCAAGRHGGSAASRSTLVRLVRALPAPEIGEVTALGIDDFARRRGQVCGSALVVADAGLSRLRVSASRLARYTGRGGLCFA